MASAAAKPNGRRNPEVVKRWKTGIDLTRRPEERWVIDFGTHMTEHVTALFEAPFQHVRASRLRVNENGEYEVRREGHRKYCGATAKPAPE